MKKFIQFSILFLAGIAGAAVDAVTVAQPSGDGYTYNFTSTGTCVAGAAPTAATAADVYIDRGIESVGVDISGTWSGTVGFSASVDGANYFTVQGYATTTGLISVATSANGRFRIPAAGYQYVCVNVTAFTSGTIVVTATPTRGQVGTMMLASDASNLRELRLGSASTLATTNSSAALLQTPPSEWAVNSTPSSATAAVASKAAGGAGVRHLARSVTACISAVAAQGDITFNLRDGATGAGTVLWSCRLAAVIGTSACCPSPVLNVLGTANTAMTLESAAAPATSNFAVATITGVSTQ